MAQGANIAAFCLVLALASSHSHESVAIGSQIWMKNNLDIDVAGSKCYGNDPANCEKYGRLYNWETAKTVCPSGWHLPNVDEWDALIDYRLFAALPGGIGISADDFIGIGIFGGWWSASDSSDNYFFNIANYFASHSAAIRNFDYSPSCGFDYSAIRQFAYSRYLASSGESTFRYDDKKYLQSVRCVKD